MNIPLKGPSLIPDNIPWEPSRRYPSEIACTEGFGCAYNSLLAKSNQKNLKSVVLPEKTAQRAKAYADDEIP
ncbi:hypothetical protein Tco_0047461 [Tanacetum coccineum]